MTGLDFLIGDRNSSQEEGFLLGHGFNPKWLGQNMVTGLCGRRGFNDEQEIEERTRNPELPVPAKMYHQLGTKHSF